MIINMIVIRVSLFSDFKLPGKREISKPQNSRIIYDLPVGNTNCNLVRV